MSYINHRRYYLTCDRPNCEVTSAPYAAWDTTAAEENAELRGWTATTAHAGNRKHYCPAHSGGDE